MISRTGTPHKIRRRMGLSRSGSDIQSFRAEVTLEAVIEFEAPTGSPESDLVRDVRRMVSELYPLAACDIARIDIEANTDA